MIKSVTVLVDIIYIALRIKIVLNLLLFGLSAFEWRATIFKQWLRSAFRRMWICAKRYTVYIYVQLLNEEGSRGGVAEWFSLSR